MHLKGQAIVRLRERKGMSQKDLAEAVGIGTDQLSRYESGQVGNKPITGRGSKRLHPRIGVLIAEALECDIEEIAVLAGEAPKATEQPTEAA